MTVLDLIIKLQNLNPKLEVLVDKGNGESFIFVSIEDIQECQLEDSSIDFVAIFPHQKENVSQN